MDDLTAIQGNDRIDLPKRLKRTIIKLTFQPMVGGIRRTVYIHKISDLINALQQIFNVLPENYALRLDTKVLDMNKDDHLKKMIIVEERKGTIFDANQKVGSEMAQMCEENKENKIQ